MKTKLLLIASAAVLSLGMGSANAAPVQLTTAQMDNVSAGGFYKSFNNQINVAIVTVVGNYNWIYVRQTNTIK